VTTHEIIQPILRRTYGNGAMVDALAQRLAERVDEESPQDWRGRDRETMVLHECWNWFSGGGTAGITAKRIEHALREAGR
jgi:hypothetical protein